MLYLITYDLREPAQDYDSLLERLRTLGATRALESVWLLVSEFRPKQLRDELFELMNYDDGLLVVTLQRGSAWVNHQVDNSEAKALLRQAQ